MMTGWVNLDTALNIFWLGFTLTWLVVLPPAAMLLFRAVGGCTQESTELPSVPEDSWQNKASALSQPRTSDAAAWPQPHRH